MHIIKVAPVITDTVCIFLVSREKEESNYGNWNLAEGRGVSCQRRVELWQRIYIHRYLVYVSEIGWRYTLTLPHIPLLLLWNVDKLRHDCVNHNKNIFVIPLASTLCPKSFLCDDDDDVQEWQEELQKVYCNL